MFALSTSSVYPDDITHGFDTAGRLGYDAVEVMVSVDRASQDPRRVKALAEYHEVAVCSVHAPCLLATQLVWGRDPWVKLERSVELAREVGADVVVVHPPFRWQRQYAEGFVEGIADLERRGGIRLAVENMYPWRGGPRSLGDLAMYAPGWDVTQEGYRHLTLDVSHAATARQDALALAHVMGEALCHLHLTDGLGSPRDEHLIPGRGSQPCAELLNHLRDEAFSGHVVVEVSTRKAANRAGRERDLAEALAFARLHGG